MRVNVNQSDFVPCPAGPQPAVCVDVVDTGWKMQSYMGEDKGMAPTFRLVFQVAELMENGSRFSVRTFDEAVKWTPKSRFRKMLTAWLGAPAVGKILETLDFNPDSLIGQQAIVNVIHVPNKKVPTDPPYANIESILPPMKGQEKMEPLKYKRLHLREDWEDPEYSSHLEYKGPGFPDYDNEPTTLPQAAPIAKQAEAAAPAATGEPAPVDTANSNVTQKQLLDIKAQAKISFGDAPELWKAGLRKELNKAVGGVKNDTQAAAALSGLTVDQAAKLLFDLRFMKPALVVSDGDTDDDVDIFKNE